MQIQRLTQHSSALFILAAVLFLSGCAAPVAAADVAPNRAKQHEAVTAGVTDDNAQWTAYLDYRQHYAGLWVNDRDISERYVPTPLPAVSPVTCTLDLAASRHNCNLPGLVITVEEGDGSILLRITLDTQRSRL